MTTISTDTLLPKIVPLVTGCNDDLAKIILADAARTFARESDIIIETRGYADYEAPDYGILPEFAIDPEHFVPLHFIAYKEDKPNKRVYVTYSLLPTADLIPESVSIRHYEAITSQALFQLYSMPGKPWSAPDMAQLYLQKYRIAAGDAMRDNNSNGAVFDQFMICCEPGDGGYIGAQNVTATFIGTDTSDGTITPNTVLAGYQGHAKGELVVGNIPSVTAKLNGNIFTVPMGYVGSPITLSVPEVNPVLNGNTVTIPAGYIKNDTDVTVPLANISDDGETVTVGVGYVAEAFTVQTSTKVLAEIQTELEGI